MILGRWAFRLPPLDGELLSSCLARNAYAHGTPPQRFLELFWPRQAVWSRDFDRDPAALVRPGEAGQDWVAEIAGHLGVPPEHVGRATLQEWRKVLGGARLQDRGDTPLLLSAGVHHRKRCLHGLQYCPDCLSEPPACYRRAWRLGFAVACEKHSRTLSDACPACDVPVVPHRTLANLTDCHACGTSLTRAGTGRCVPDGVARLQDGLLALLEGKGMRVGPWTASEAFGGVRALLAISAARPVRQALRNAFGLSFPSPGHSGQFRFERSRITARMAGLETVAAWVEGWPASFREGARAARLTQASFARVQFDETLAAEIAALPPGTRRRRPVRVFILDDPALRRLRRRDPSAYRAARAGAILSALGRPT